MQNDYPAFEDVKPILYQEKKIITLLNKLSTPRFVELVGENQENLEKLVKAISILSRYKNKDIRAFKNIKLFYDSFEQKAVLHHLSKLNFKILFLLFFIIWRKLGKLVNP